MAYSIPPMMAMQTPPPAPCGRFRLSVPRWMHAVRWQLAVVLLGAWAAIGCPPDPAEEIVRLQPRVPLQLAQHLAHDTDEELRAYASEAGLDAISMARAALFGAPVLAAPEEFAAVETTLAPYIARLVVVLESEFALGSEASHYRAYCSRGLAERRWIVSRTVDVGKLPSDSTLSNEEKAKSYVRWLEETRPYADAFNRSEIYASYCELVARIDPSRVQECLAGGIAEAQAHGDWTAACQMLGMLGEFHRQHGEIHRMRQCWDQALVYARRTKSWHEARILSFYASWFKGRGQLAVTRDLLLQAMERCRALRGGRAEIRFLVEWLEFLVDLECWELFDRDLQRAEILLERQRKLRPTFELPWWEARLLELRVARDAASGTRSVGLTSREAFALIDALPPCPFRERTRLGVLRSLLRSGMVHETLAALEEGRAICVASNIVELLPAYDLLIARASFDLGDIATCEAALARFRGTPEPQEFGPWLEHDALRARAALREGRVVEARRSIEEGFDRLASEYRRMDGSPETALALLGGRELLAAGHDIVGPAPVAGYDLEMLWRTLPARTVIVNREGSVRRNSLLDRSARESATLRASLASVGAIHCLYSVAGDRLRRWTVVGGHVACDTLATDLSDLARRSTAIADKLADMNGALISRDAGFLRESHALAHLLLPAVVFESAAPMRLFVSADGFLLGTSFESLNLEPTTFAPLGTRHQVATLQLAQTGKQTTAAGSPIGMFNPAMPETLLLSHPILSEKLHYSEGEVARLCELFPQTQRLSGAGATKAALLAHWESSPLLYFATHVVREPQVRYITFLPLAANEEGGVQDPYIEIADVRRANLSGCKLVVLSGCSTGAPYVTTGAASPSLGEAFAQAGAHAVVHTYWPVRDDAAASVMDGFIRAYAECGDAVAAMTQARVQALEQGLDPRAWLAYSVMVNAAAPEPTATPGAPARPSP